jgi:hypothetical protein
MSESPPWSSQDQPSVDQPAGYGQPPGYGQSPGYGQPAGYGQPPGDESASGHEAPGGYGAAAGYGPQPGYESTGYGVPPPGYGGYRPPPAVTAPMPGGVPLRPLAVGDILNGAFTLIRGNPLATLGLAAIIEVLAGVVTAFFSWSEQKLTHQLQSTLAGQPTSTRAGHALLHFFAGFAPYLFLTVAVTLVVQAILTGTLTGVLGRGLIGDKITIGQAWKMARLPVVIAVSLLIIVIELAPWVLLGLIVLGLAVVKLKVLALIVGIFGWIGLVPLTIWVGVRLVLAPPVVVLERAGPATALRRSWQLVQGSWWRVFGIYLLATVIVGLIAGIIEIPFTLVGLLFGGSSFLIPNLTHVSAGPSLLAVIVSAIGGVIATTCTRPVSAGVLVLLYADLRMRKEGLDLVLRRAGQAPGLSWDEFTGLWQQDVSAADRGVAPG